MDYHELQWAEMSEQKFVSFPQYNAVDFSMSVPLKPKKIKMPKEPQKMRVILGPKDSGKTDEMIRLAHKHDAIIVCPNLDDIMHVKKRAHALSLTIQEPIRWKNLKHHWGAQKYVIDDLDRCLQSSCPGDIVGASLTEDL